MDLSFNIVVMGNDTVHTLGKIFASVDKFALFRSHTSELSDSDPLGAILQLCKL